MIDPICAYHPHSRGALCQGCKPCTGYDDRGCGWLIDKDGPDLCAGCQREQLDIAEARGKSSS